MRTLLERSRSALARYSVRWSATLRSKSFTQLSTRLCRTALTLSAQRARMQSGACALLGGYHITWTHVHARRSTAGVLNQPGVLLCQVLQQQRSRPIPSQARLRLHHTGPAPSGAHSPRCRIDTIQQARKRVSWEKGSLVSLLPRWGRAFTTGASRPARLAALAYASVRSSTRSCSGASTTTLYSCVSAASRRSAWLSVCAPAHVPAEECPHRQCASAQAPSCACLASLGLTCILQRPKICA